MRARGLICAGVVAFILLPFSLALAAEKDHEHQAEPKEAKAKGETEAVKAEAGQTVSGTVRVVRTKAKTKGPKSYKHVVVYLEKEGGNNVTPPAPPAQHAQMNQVGLVFVPHVMAIQKGTTVDFLNSDNDKHNVFCPDKCCGENMNLGSWSKGKIRSYTFELAGAATMLCKLHLEMAAYIVIVDTPYFTIAEIDGKPQQAAYTIKNVPPGKYILKLWHKKLKLKGGDREITVENGKAITADLEITKAKYAKKK